MGVISFVDDASVLSQAMVKKDYKGVYDEAVRLTPQCDYLERKGNVIVGCSIRRNQPLSKLYGNSFYVVKFVLGNVQIAHSSEQEELICAMLSKLKKHVISIPGYYNFRLPAHVVDLLRGFNRMRLPALFCGGNVDLIRTVKDNGYPVKKGVAFWASKEYQNQHAQALCKISKEAFTSYHGQYHISPITEPYAGMIYEQWLRNSIAEGTALIAVAEERGDPIAFALYSESEAAVSTELVAVHKDSRGKGIYRDMLELGIMYAEERNKVFLNSTQMDNYIVQGVNMALGLKPFFSVYLFHFDNRV